MNLRFLMKRLFCSVCVVCATVAAWAAEPYDAALAYVESNGSQYFDTGLVLSNDVAATIELSLLPGHNRGGIFGGRTTVSNENISAFHTDGNQLYMDFNNGNYTSYRAVGGGERLFTTSLRIELSAALRQMCMLKDDRTWWRESCVKLVNQQEFSLAGTAWILGVSGAGGTLWGHAAARLYSVRIVKGTETLRDYQPCVKDGVVGLYDRATRTFLPPAAGVLAPGPVVVTPAADRAADDASPQFVLDRSIGNGPVRYLESDGTAYLDTGVTLTSAMSADLVFELLPGSGATGIFGARSNVDRQNIALSCEATTLKLAADFSNSNAYFSYRLAPIYTVGTTYFIHLGGDGCTYTNLASFTGTKATLAWNDLSSPFEAPGSAYVFKTRGTTWANAAARLYSLVIKEGDTVIRDYEPYLKDGVACLHDRKTDTFLFNANSQGGAFTPGELLTNSLFSAGQTNAIPRIALADLGTDASSCEVLAVTSYAPAYDRAVAYLESDGTQVLDTGLKISGDMDVSITFAILDYSNGPAGVFGARTSVDARNVGISYATSSQISCDFLNEKDYSTYRASVNPTVAERVYTTRLNAQIRTLGGHTNSAALPSTDWTTAQNALIFAVNGTQWDKAKARLYALTISQNGQKLRDYQPCVKDGCGCLYERVSGTFLTLGTTGANHFGLGETVPTPETDYADAGERRMPRVLVLTNRVLSVVNGVTNRFPIGPLQPGTRYVCTLVATNGLPNGVATLPGAATVPCTFETTEETMPAETSDRLRLAVTPQKGGRLGLEVSRTGTSATRLHLLHGRTSGDATPEAWRGDEVIGEFAADETALSLQTPPLGTGDDYIRLYTEDGAWSRVVLTTGILAIPRGTLVIVR